ncbi:MAG: class I SAM-dependent RNA methyltransferase, partial [Alphaproteobacteria bacterium]|nr:class I SAM-dependent RNA methyltransferase [Alphaproteobacteria bacterium]
MPEGEIRTLAIERIGAQGDGIALTDAGPVFVPFTVAGDVVRARLGAAKGERREAALVAVETPGPSRAVPPCRHFGICGGCTLQHLGGPAYADWKRARVVDALAQRGLADTPVEPAILVPAGARRRLRFSFRARPPAAGFYARASHRIVDLAECPLALPPLVHLLAALRTHGAALLDGAARGEAAATATETGIDCVLRIPGPLDRARREACARFADAADLARLSWQAPLVG